MDVEERATHEQNDKQPDKACSGLFAFVADKGLKLPLADACDLFIRQSWNSITRCFHSTVYKQVDLLTVDRMYSARRVLHPPVALIRLQVLILIRTVI